MQLPVNLQNGNEVNRETLPPQAAFSVCDSTKHKQLPVTLQNGNEVNRETLPPQAASSICDSTKHNGLVTLDLFRIKFYT